MRKDLIFLWGKNVTLDPRFAYKICRSAQITPNLSKGWVIELLVSLHRWGVHSRAWFGIRVSPKSTWTQLMSPHVQWLTWESEGNFSFFSNVVPQWVFQIIAKSEQHGICLWNLFMYEQEVGSEAFFINISSHP
jgi:hypothetical protein